MYASQSPVVKDLVLIGGGHSHVIVLKKLGMQALAGVRTTLISRELQSPYSGMLPGYIAGHYSFEDIHIDLLPLSRFAAARFFHDEVIGLDTEKKLVICRNRPPLNYDVLSIDIGSSPRLPVDAETHSGSIAVKPIDTFLDKWHVSLERLLENAHPAGVGVVGAGAAGVELILAIQQRLKRECKQRKIIRKEIAYHLFSDTEAILPTYSVRVQQKFSRVLDKRGIQFHPRARIQAASSGSIETESGEVYPLEEVFWATSATAQSWPKNAGLEVDDSGFIQVRDTLESLSHEGVFASGDIANVANHPRPKAGVFAVRQGPVLYENLCRKLLHQSLREYVPQQEFLSLVSTGNKYALASRSGWILQGRLIWQWKNWIDRRFMKKFQQLPPMATPAAMDIAEGLLSEPEREQLLHEDMRCAGCGGKVAASTLERALELLKEANADSSLIIDIKTADDAALLEVPAGKLLVQSVDYFRSFVDDPYLLGQVAANHALNDLYAMGASAHSAQAIVNLPNAEEKKVVQDLLQLLQGAVEVLSEAGASLLGGHTGEAAEMSMGFAVNGLVDEHRVLRKRGLQVGDKIILTKALGTGTLFAADMRHRAKARWISGAIKHMLQSNRAASSCLLEHDAHACTDISGFGLLGHLREMLGGSGPGIKLYLDKLPVLEGSMQCFAMGIVSSIHEANHKSTQSLLGTQATSQHSCYPLLFDPQTAGGLLASVANASAENCVSALHGLGYTQATIIGEVTGRPQPGSSIEISF